MKSTNLNKLRQSIVITLFLVSLYVSYGDDDFGERGVRRAVKAIEKIILEKAKVFGDNSDN